MSALRCLRRYPLNFEVEACRAWARRAAVVLVAIGGIGVACAPSRISPPAATQLTVTGSEFKFQSSTNRVAAGQPVTITFENKGTIEHNLHLEATGTHLIAAPGQTVSATVVFPTAGDFSFVCSVPGHQQAGMDGKVQAGDPLPARAVAASADSLAAKPVVADAPLPPLPPGTPRVPQGQVAPPLARRDPALVKVNLEIQEVVGALADGVGFKYWTFGGTVPGPMIRVRQGDTVELTLTNPAGIPLSHSINVHAAIGPGGGAFQVAPGSENTFRFKAEHPGVWVYHCMTPTVGEHVSNGMYGLVVVEPPEGLPPVDREFYVMQSDVYVQGTPNAPGLHDFAFDKLLREQPDFVVYNGSVGSLTDDRAMSATVVASSSALRGPTSTRLSTSSGWRGIGSIQRAPPRP